MTWDYEVVQEGRWTDCYQEAEHQYKIQVVRSETKFGSGDDRDDPYDATDIPMTCYYILFLPASNTPINNKIPYRACEHFLSAEDVIREAERMTSGKVEWN